MNAITIKSAQLKTQQQIHGISTIVLPFIGSVAAVVMTFQVGINAVDIGLLIVMYYLTLMGITVGFHRHFAHCAFQTHTAVRVIFAILGSMAAQGPLTYWVATHRRHHKYADAYGDPHSPYVKEEKQYGFLEGLWHSHMEWTFNHEITNSFLFAKDMLRDPLMAKISQMYYFWLFLGVFIPAVLGGILTRTWIGVLSGFLWGGCVRIFLQHHFGFWIIGSLAHMWGNRPYETSDQSRNNIWFAIPTGGEMWHNNHHAFPSSAMFGLEWWQIDLGAWLIRSLETVNLAWDVKVPPESMKAAKRNKVESLN